MRSRRHPPWWFPCAFFALLLALATVAGACTDAGAESATHTRPAVFLPFFVETHQGARPEEQGARLYEARAHQPILAPGGRPVTLGEFSQVQGLATVSCRDGGVYVTVDLSGLIPGGVYTLWHTTYRAPGFDPRAEDLNLIGLGALGTPDGSESGFVADAEGQGRLEAFTRGGALSVQGTLAACPLTDEHEWHLTGAYHIDGRTHGGAPGPEGAVVEQFAFRF